MHGARLPARALAACLLALGALALALRALGALGPPTARAALPLSFVLLAAAPWLLLRPEGRRAIGWVRPPRWGVVAVAALTGGGAALLCHLLFLGLFGTGADHGFASVAESYRRSAPTEGWSLAARYALFTVPALMFSPWGEELFFRGLLQQALQARWGAARATGVECALFGLVHLLHHGLAPGAGGAAPSAASAAVWVLAMAATGALFALWRQRSGTLATAIAAHMGFNAAMNAVVLTALP